MKQLIVLILVITTLFGCNTNENTCGQAYIGGEIINPSNDYVTLFRDGLLIDTLFLDKNNRFSYQIETLDPGLHSFYHGNENQVAIIEPNDSIMIRLNTFDFDESLVFSGQGSKKNNYLINMFLKLEDEEHFIYEASKLNPEKFLKKLDSIKNEKYQSLDAFKQKYSPSDYFTNVAKIGIDYSHYRDKEIYAYRYFGSNEPLPLDSLPNDYFDFRKEIDYNREDLKKFYPYYNFLFPHFNNLAMEKYFEDNNEEKLVRTNIKYHLNKLELIDDMVDNEMMKNILLKIPTINFLNYSTSFEDSDAMFNSFIEKNVSKQNEAYITNLHKTLNRLRPGNNLPDIELLNFKNETATLSNVTKRSTVLYFWTSANKYHFKNSHAKANELKILYPSIDFISININSNNESNWKQLLKQNNIDVSNEYRFRNPEIAKKQLAIQYIIKVIVVDRNDNIITSNANLFKSDFKDLLDEIK
ncbi:hypothetical protein [Pontimicrobium sp. SW4]|uniref:Thioredoxin domain-containing protein n=1 Tax=Pontimicrobium sp. SW4 TaxID=3153519 RepID=A0AAU7BP61_9FLAO